VNKNNKQHFVLIFLLSTLLFGCNSEEEAPELTDKKVAIAFFDAIYNSKDLKKAISYSSANLQKELKKYKTAKHLSRRLLNMSFDSVKMETAAANTQIIDEFNVQVTMTILFTGQRNGTTFKDYKKVKLIKKNNIWLVDKFIEDN